MTIDPPRGALRRALASRLAGRVVLVGVGNPLFGDDAAGCLLAERLAGAPGLDVVPAEDVPESFVPGVVDARPDVVVLADAVDLGAPPGSVAILDADAMVRYEASTHRVPLGLIAEIIRRASGADAFVLAIQPGPRRFGTGPSAEVAATVGVLADLIRDVAASRPEARAAAAAREAHPC